LLTFNGQKDADARQQISWTSMLELDALGNKQCLQQEKAKTLF
jgi:hypothetical protein